MAQINGEHLVPVLGGDVEEILAIVVRGVVDQHANRAELRFHVGDRGANHRDVGDVAALEMRGGRPGDSLCDQSIDKCARCRFVDIEKCNPRALPPEMLGERRADSRSAAGDQHDAINEAWINSDIGH